VVGWESTEPVEKKNTYFLILAVITHMKFEIFFGTCKKVPSD
jgi:hypothetical protein